MKRLFLCFIVLCVSFCVFADDLAQVPAENVEKTAEAVADDSSLQVSDKETKRSAKKENFFAKGNFIIETKLDFKFQSIGTKDAGSFSLWNLSLGVGAGFCILDNFTAEVGFNLSSDLKDANIDGFIQTAYNLELGRNIYWSPALQVGIGSSNGKLHTFFTAYIVSFKIGLNNRFALNFSTGY